MPTRVLKTGPIFSRDPIKRKVIDPAAEETLDFAKGIIRDRTPEDTGKARAGWEIDEGKGIIFNDVAYVRYLEEGTRHMKAVAMVARSSDAIGREFVQIAGEKVRNELN
ncbi:MAG: hypothetical protein ACFE0I_02580 [Elainellaceae cyanobacterium]